MLLQDLFEQTTDFSGLFTIHSVGFSFGALFGSLFTLRIGWSRMNLLTFFVLWQGAWSAKRMTLFTLCLFAYWRRLER
jgi:hypothetical protein